MRTVFANSEVSGFKDLIFSSLDTLRGQSDLLTLVPNVVLENGKMLNLMSTVCRRFF